ncbi:MAG: tRNA threonylcarbamoyladenosine dehydratase [Bacteroidales bacterium]|nr:tRNA threonylcarbamoyladenosine dehydratase [Bacteroidales bacterium]
MTEWLDRTRMLLGEEGLERLSKAHVLVVGLGGVGAYAAEMICRAGIGELTIVDGDVVHPTNRNRQLSALISTEGMPKAAVIASRLLDINPELKLNVIAEYIKDDRMIDILNHPYDYVVDAIDTLAPKVFLIFHSLQKNLRVVSSMGAGGKFDPSAIKIADISNSYNCTLARMLRKRLHKLGVHKGFKVVFSSEFHDKTKVCITEGEANKKTTVGTISYFPAIFGCFAASVVIRELLENPI